MPDRDPVAHYLECSIVADPEHLPATLDLLERYRTDDDPKEWHRAAEEVAQSREELRALAARLESVREEERTRIARELHDELGQSLTGLKLDLAWLERRLNRHSQSDLVDRCGNLLQRFDDVMISVRRIITELRPSVLDQLGLPDAIEWQAQDFAVRTGLALEHFDFFKKSLVSQI